MGINALKVVFSYSSLSSCRHSLRCHSALLSSLYSISLQQARFFIKFFFLIADATLIIHFLSLIIYSMVAYMFAAEMFIGDGKLRAAGVYGHDWAWTIHTSGLRYAYFLIFYSFGIYSSNYRNKDGRYRQDRYHLVQT